MNICYPTSEYEYSSQNFHTSEGLFWGEKQMIFEEIWRQRLVKVRQSQSLEFIAVKW